MMSAYPMGLSDVTSSSPSFGPAVFAGILAVLLGVFFITRRSRVRSFIVRSQDRWWARGFTEEESAREEMNMQTTGYIAFCGLFFIVWGASAIVSGVAALVG